jgi:hypothetical protein
LPGPDLGGPGPDLGAPGLTRRPALAHRSSAAHSPTHACAPAGAVLRSAALKQQRREVRIFTSAVLAPLIALATCMAPRDYPAIVIMTLLSSGRQQSHDHDRPGPGVQRLPGRCPVPVGPAPGSAASPQPALARRSARWCEGPVCWPRIPRVPRAGEAPVPDRRSAQQAAVSCARVRSGPWPCAGTPAGLGAAAVDGSAGLRGSVYRSVRV